MIDIDYNYPLIAVNVTHRFNDPPSHIFAALDRERNRGVFYRQYNGRDVVIGFEDEWHLSSLDVFDVPVWFPEAVPPEADGPPMLICFDLSPDGGGHAKLLVETALSWNDRDRDLVVHFGPPAPETWTQTHPLAIGVRAVLAGPGALAALAIRLPLDPRPIWARLRGDTRPLR